MRKNAWVICCCTAVLAAFGTFFRWLQDQVCFEADTGLAVRGSIWPYAVALMINQFGALFTGSVNVIGLIFALLVLAFIIYMLFFKKYTEATRLSDKAVK